ncbi:4'-phosphopantetheinyl transferase superfamily protein [Streptomyces sp. MUM 203J]|uniref:4'-phosphopantetheinyl transferase family protein n=1 Tax=Streptomyces sp. MUM 203J TaxID=2791990 RepID=UPI001F03C7D7|nr:4'-phosphopantetheinyl transferase superfamily protein [Streptomyces sp. MUM 203J]MCH0542325.1 4'-phosphopantetheinyl transferase superfamily protein [Streptomyces sp. MUM 203J]
MTGPAPVLTSPAVAPGQLDLWLVRPPKTGGAASLDLSPLDRNERHRAASFVRPADGLLYASAHLALRRLLGAYLGIAARDVTFVREPCPCCGKSHGRPAVATPDPPLHFSLSHSSGLALVAVAAVTVGADLEKLPRAETVAICSEALHPGEREELARVPETERQELFSRLWTRKEAYLKGLGTGLSRSPSADYLGADPARRPAGWSVIDIPSGPRHAAAVAVKGVAPVRATVRRLAMEWLYTDDVAALFDASAREERAV